MENPSFCPDDGHLYPPKGVPTIKCPIPPSPKDPQKSRSELDPILGRKDLHLSYFRQFMIAITISTGLYVISFLIGSTSLLPAFLNQKITTPNQTYTAEDLKWLASGPILISIPGNFLAVFLTETFGPTSVLRGSLLSCFALYILKALLPTLPVLWFTRVLLWIIVGMFDIICVPLVALLSEPHIRGLCGALPELTTSFGILFVFLTFSFLQDTYSILIDSIPVFLGFLGSFYVPESPYWLYQRGKEEEARKSIARVIGPSRKDKQEELFNEILSRYENTDKESKDKKLSLTEQMMLLKQPQYWKPVMLSIAIFGFREFGGNNILFFYAITIFEQADIEVDIFVSTIIVSVARVLSTFLSASIQDKFGRRKLLIGTVLISALCLIFSGCVLFFEVKVLKILPLIGIIIFILMTGIGMGPIPFIIVGEVMPSDIKFLGTAVVYSLFNLYQFLIVNVTPSILRLFSVGTILISFSIFNFVIAGILYFMLPETKRKSFLEIEALFK